MIRRQSNSDGTKGAHRRPAVVIWLALVALLSNALFPAALLMGRELPQPGGAAFGSGFCSTVSGRAVPGKSKALLVAHHCAQCTIEPAILPPRRTGTLVLTGEPPGTANPAPQAPSAHLPLRDGCLQPRAPPLAA